LNSLRERNGKRAEIVRPGEMGGEQAAFSTAKKCGSIDLIT
jgi:hypothetical protein